ncbi:hypothetical protein POM88_049680 [Heracleum sosnowskyi]|uniref:Telomeric repeat-binding factor n=1 Tax=Heracleum sosnowskyi TaxID=360622 RepID=A0AAD8GXE0_9APIA|nr:hypothetical protein POM88_049680 [Heracleum sosnowskyi]
MDADIGRWILDFFVRQPIDDSTLCSLLSTLPVSDTDSNLKKLLLLRNIQSQISTLSGPSDDLLCLLEQLEEHDHRDNVKTVESIKRAYCAVAVHCTLKFLQNDEVECFETAVKKIWNFRVGGMVKYGGDVGLLSDELVSWKEDIAAALRDCNVRKGLLDKWKAGVGVVEAVRGFVDEVKEVMGPSFLEFATQDEATIKVLFGAEDTQEGDTLAPDDGTLRQSNGMEETEQGEKGHTLAPKDGTLTDQGEKGDTLARDDGTLRQLNGMEDTEQDIQEGAVHRRSKVRAAKQHKRLTPRTSRGVKIVDNDEMSDASPHNNYDCLSTPEVTKLQESLRSSSLELQGMVKDPLPGALEVAKNVASKMDYVDKRTDVIPAENSNLGNEGSTRPTNATKPSLMERNKTARTYEWDEFSDGSADPGTRPHLPSPKKRLVTPLKKHEDPKPLRRKRRFWSNLEEDTLRAGVQKYGMGNWKLILNMYKDIFDERTEVDLKDKWRNMTT